MAQNEPYGGAEDPRFARYDRSGRHDDYRSSGAGSSGTRGRSPGRYDGHTPRTYRDSPARDNPGRGSRASYDGYESTGYDSRPPRRNGTGSDRDQAYRGDPRRAAPPPRDARVTRDPRAGGEHRRPRDPDGTGTRDRVPYRGSDGSDGYGNSNGDARRNGNGGYGSDRGGGGRHGTAERAAANRATGERPAGGRRGTGERAVRDRSTGERAAVSRGYDDAPARAARPRRSYPSDRQPPGPRQPATGRHPHEDRHGRHDGGPARHAGRPDRHDSDRDDHLDGLDRLDRVDRPSRPRPARPAGPGERYDRPRHGLGGDSDVDEAGRPRFVPYDYGDGNRGGPKPAQPSGGRSPWLVFAAACVIAVVVLAAAAMSRSSRENGQAPDPDATATQSAVPNPSGTGSTDGTGTPQAQYGQEVAITRDGAQVGVLTVGSPEAVESFYAGTYTPDRGPMFATFQVTMRNSSAAPLEYNMFEFYVQSPAGERLDPTIGRDPAFETGSMDPGETVSGWISFDAGEHGTLVYAPSAFGVVVAEWPF